MGMVPVIEFSQKASPFGASNATNIQAERSGIKYQVNKVTSPSVKDVVKLTVCMFENPPSCVGIVPVSLLMFTDKPPRWLAEGGLIVIFPSWVGIEPVRLFIFKAIPP